MGLAGKDSVHVGSVHRRPNPRLARRSVPQVLIHKGSVSTRDLGQEPPPQDQEMAFNRQREKAVVGSSISRHRQQIRFKQISLLKGRLVIRLVAATVRQTHSSSAHLRHSKFVHRKPSSMHLVSAGVKVSR